ncbi:MAG: hypothetical protein ACE5LU_29400, partial [Anaerolineae bacterium]
REEWLALVYWGGLSAYCTGYAIHEGYTVYLSLIGRVTAVKAVWAAFMDHKGLRLPDEALLARLPADEETRYETLNVRLPETDWGHTVLVHSQATQNNLPNQFFYVLSGSAEPPLRRFWAQWNRCLPYPSQPDWAAYLWQEGARHQLITECQSRGTYCWAVIPSGRWAEIIAGGIQDGEIGL